MKIKFWCCLLAVVILAFPTLADQAKESSSPVPTSGFSTRHDLSPPLRDLARLVQPGAAGPPREIPLQRFEKTPAASPANASDLLLGPLPAGGAPMPAPIITFDGPDDDDNAEIVGFRVAPPDSNGDVGPNHYVQFVNLIFEIFNKTTGESVLGPLPGNTPFIGFGGVCESTNDGDPIALYDQFTGRWILSQFAIFSGVQCVAVSQTSDPTGSWHRYEFDVSPGLNDYPKIGVWTDGYYMMFHEFNPGFVGTRVVSMEKDKMIQGLPAQFVSFFLPVGTEIYATVQPPHIEGLTPPPVGSPAPFVMAYDDEDWGPPFPANDWYKVWEFDVDWTTPANSTFLGPVNLVAPDWDDNMCGFSRACIPQPPPGEGVDSFSDFTMYRLVYRNFGTHESLYVVTGADVGGDHEGVRWAEIRSPLGVPVLHQVGTHAPDAHHRWVPSIAADKDGNIAIGYSISSSSLFPSIRYAGRLATDPLGTLPQTETSLHEGAGSQTSSANRWGDYTSLSIDETDPLFPDCVFWFTNQYQQQTGSFDWDMRIGAFRFPSCVGGPTGTLAGTVVNAANGNPIEGATITANGTFSTQTDENGDYSMLLPTGTYDVTASKFGYASQTAFDVVINEDETTTQDFALVGVPAVTVDGFVTDGSGGGFPLYARVEVGSAAGTEIYYTDPATGYYSFTAFAETAYTITVTAQVQGYNPASRNITTGSSDQQENFALTVNQATCNAPGYSVKNLGTLAAANFEGGIPAGWTITDNTTNCFEGNPTSWSTESIRPNLTGGGGLFAIADSDRCGPPVNFDSNLLTPTFDLTGFAGGVRIEFNSDYFDLCGGGNDEVKLQMFNGTAWTDIFDFCGQFDRRGPRVESFTTSAGNGAPNAQVRFRYAGGWDWWWEIDDVMITKSACTFDGGGLIYGNVYDANTDDPINGARVSLDTGQSTTTVATPSDPTVEDGFYVIYAPLNGDSPGVRTMTVSKTNYGTVNRNVIPVPNGVREENFELPAGMLSATPQEMRKRLNIGGSGDSTLTLNNTGGRDANYNMMELNVPPPTNRPAGPFEEVDIPFADGTKPSYYAAIARDSRNVPRTGPPLSGPVWPNTGEYVDDFTTTLEIPWGAGFDFTGSAFWISNPGVFFGSINANHEYTLDGEPTGSSIPTDPAGGFWAADMAYVGLTNKFWQVNVGGDNCIFEFDPVSEEITGNKICPAFGTSMRGLAYDTATGNFYAGTWNGNFIMEFTAEGSTVRTVNVGLPVSGLAYNATTQHLFVQVNDANQQVYLLDASTPSLDVLGQFILQNSSGGNAFGAYEGAGLEMDCAGNLWAVNQTTKKVHINNAGESGACALDIPWLSENPESGVVPAGGSAQSIFSFTAAGQTPGCKEAQVLVTNDTPYGILTIVAGLTVQFNDVPPGSFGDAYIHAIAGAGISLGCGGGNFCPNDVMTRRIMAVWLLRGRFGSDYDPPHAIGIFADVSPESFAADHIEDLYNRGITGGCATDPLRYCPENPVTRAQMAVFLLRTEEGSDYEPPACEGLFADMDCSSFFTPWAEELYRRGITSGCATDPLRYCPNAETTRAQMSIFTSRTFGVPACKQ